MTVNYRLTRTEAKIVGEALMRLQSRCTAVGQGLQDANRIQDLIERLARAYAEAGVVAEPSQPTPKVRLPPVHAHLVKTRK